MPGIPRGGAPRAQPRRLSCAGPSRARQDAKRREDIDAKQLTEKRRPGPVDTQTHCHEVRSRESILHFTSYRRGAFNASSTAVGTPSSAPE